MATQILGLIGKKRSGKDTFAHALPGYTRVAFADPLRQAALALDPYVGRPCLPGQLSPQRDVRLSDVIDALGWERAKDCVPEVRRILQRFGTESIRSIDPDFWIRAGIQAIEAVEGPVVVTDCRYPNEADTIRALGGKLVRITRPGYTSEGDAHPSESALDGYAEDWLVLNDGTVADLAHNARTVAAQAAVAAAL
ncbi:adenylate kinase [Arthrobacter phage Liebe]|uniref:Deoxynucleoside monophosphate kinase n=2 Tax=Arthrobacter virus Liebe TaxID=2734245 RepID=A0A3G2KHQ0_9CAUD|nr:adenylate kinase [Arthrobacter phage Liebe]AYN58505.1 deoxynucleoside monophosphate kinase [Arthrobacter phage Maureen]AZF93757.1 deoxynucleoside monophosphate kinase [Arthrobacter phage Liebe]